MAKPENLSYLNYVLLVKSMGHKDNYRVWNSFAKKFLATHNGHYIKLTYMNFEDFDLRNADLRCVDFTGSRLVNCNLSGTSSALKNLTGSIFDYGDLRSANLSHALLAEASFISATLIDANGSDPAQLKNAVMNNSNWERARVTSDQLSLTHIHGVKNINPETAKEIVTALYQSLIKKDKAKKPEQAVHITQESQGSPNVLVSGEIIGHDTPLPSPSPFVQPIPKESQ